MPNRELTVLVSLVSGSKMGSFEVSIGNIVFFSKLALGYFPHVTLLTERIKEFYDDIDEGMLPEDVMKRNYSPIKQNPHVPVIASPKKKNPDPKSPYMKGNPHSSKGSKGSPTVTQKKQVAAPSGQAVSATPPPPEPKEEPKAEVKAEPVTPPPKEEPKVEKKEEPKPEPVKSEPK